MLQGIPGVGVYLDDILVSGATDSDHRQRVDRVLEILSSRGLRRFLDNLATTIEPLTRLLRKNCFSWGNSQQQAFNRAKKMLQSHSVLIHFDPSNEIVLSCDASPYGVGAVLAHVVSDGTEQPIAYYSRSLVPAEKNYSQLDKGAISISIFMVGNLKL